METAPNWVTALQSMAWEQALQMLVALLLGGIVGLEREWHGRSAGLRTNMIVAMGACLFTILSLTGFPSTGTADPARVAAQIVSGIGFLGAGLILQHKNHVRGLTTAATVWLVAAIGMAVGVKAYFLATVATLLATFVLNMLRPISKELIDHDPKPMPNQKRQGKATQEATPTDDGNDVSVDREAA